MSNELIKKWESFRAVPYKCSAGVPTIGYGTTVYPTGKKVAMNDPAISEATASMFLDAHLHKHVRPVISEKVKGPLNINEREAIESLIYNIGSSAFAKSTLLKKLNAYDFKGAANEFLRWNKAGGRVIQGLKNRRAEERALFLSPPYKEALPIEPIKELSFFERLLKFFKGE